MSAGLDDDLDALVTHFNEEVTALVSSAYKDSKAIVSILDSSVIPLLHHVGLMSIKESEQYDRVQQPSLKKLFSVSLNCYIQVLIDPRPAIGLRPKDWTKSRKGCGCAECLKLDSFLVNPVTESAIFQKYKPHIQGQLEKVLDPCKEIFEYETLYTLRPQGHRIAKTHNVWKARDMAWRKSCKSALEKIQELWEVQGRENEVLGNEIRNVIDQNSWKRLEGIVKGMGVM